ncbi:MAG: glycoside hydrolase family 140 protein [Tepidisphaerales bacterium]
MNPAQLPTRSLYVSPCRRHLLRPDGSVFFYLADTAWELFHRLSREEAEHYLRDRAEKRFTAIQAVVLAEIDGLTVPNPAGHLPLHDGDPARPNEAYFADVDHVVRCANRLGLFIAMLPTWGDKWGTTFPQDKPIFNPDNAYTYGRFLGRRYRDDQIIWVLGGDRPVVSDVQRQTLEALARGLSDGDGNRHLKTFHPVGQYSSAMFFHNAPWLDFHMVQTGHSRDRDNYTNIAAEYARTPHKPVIDGEPGYENIPNHFHIDFGRLDAWQCRKFAYWAVFSGACGHTYGCNEVWQMYREGAKPLIFADTPWHKAIHFPGAGQMQHLRQLIESGPYHQRLPDQSLIASSNPTGPHHLRACRDPDARWALVYFPDNVTTSLRVFQLLSRKLTCRWFDPRTGQTKEPFELSVDTWQVTPFTPPGTGDWVLILQRA